MNQRNMTSLYLHYKDQILLLYRKGSRVANNLWIASAGGHMEEAELNDAKACVLRELREELGLEIRDVNSLDLRYVTLRHTKEEIRVIYFFFAEVKEKMTLISNEGELQWFPLANVDHLPMPLTAKRVLEHYAKKGQYDSRLYAGVMTGDQLIVSELDDYQEK